MSSRDPEPQLSVLDARLAEIDRRLSTIQTGLAEDEAALAADQAPPSPARPTVDSERVAGLHAQQRIQSAPVERATPARTTAERTQPEPGSDREVNAELVDRLYELASSQQRVLESMRELLGAHEQVLRSGAASAGTGGPVSVSAGPFVSTDALRDFERALQTLPEVRSVELRAFEGGDRAILDVHLT